MMMTPEAPAPPVALPPVEAQDPPPPPTPYPDPEAPLAEPLAGFNPAWRTLNR